MSLSSKLITGAIAVSAFAFAASAQDTKVAPKADVQRAHDGMRGERMGRRGGPGGFELRGINLTDAQKDQIHQIHEANKPSQAQIDEMRTLREAKKNGTLTADQQARLQALRTEGKQKAESIHSQILAILTAEQKAQIETRRQEMRQRMEQRRQQRQQNRSRDTTKDTTKVT